MLVYGEVTEYIKGAQRTLAYQRALRALFRELRQYPLNFRIMERYAELRRRLRPPHGPGLIGDIDTVIAAIALEHDLVLVTADSDFRRVPGLNVMVVGPFH